MGVDDSIFWVPGRTGAIVKEFETHGNEVDKKPTRTLLAGTYVNPPDPRNPVDIPVRCKTMAEFMRAPQVVVAGLGQHHVLALRLYTTSSYTCINNPMRAQPPQRPHPFEVTTYFISDAIKKLRVVAGEDSGANTVTTYYRGLKGMTISMAFLTQSGTKCASMSTSSSMDVVNDFATAIAR
jgi:hypothetical protein